MSLGRFPVKSNFALSADPFQSPDAFYIGGVPTRGWVKESGLAKNRRGRPGSLVITGQPWGPFNAGALESILWGTEVDSQNGVATLDWRQGAGHVPRADGIGQYIGVTNSEAMVIAHGSFGVGSVTIFPALTLEQISMLRVGMYITTNIVNSSASTVPSANFFGAAGLPADNYYSGIISGWSQAVDLSGKPVTIIRVPAWDNRNFSKHSNDAVPGNMSGDSIDTYWSDYGVPTVFIGSSTDGGAHNEYIFYDGTKGNYKAGNINGKVSNAGHATSLAHALESDEIDLRYTASKVGEVHLDGVTISVASSGGIGRTGLTKDSYMLDLSGDAPNMLILDGPTDGNSIIGHSLYFGGGLGSSFSMPRYEMADTAAYADNQGNALMRLATFMTKDSHVTGAPGNSIHLGVVNGGFPGDGLPDALSAWGQIGFSKGGVLLCGGRGSWSLSAPSCGVQVDYRGKVIIGGVTTVLAQMNVNAPLAMGAGQDLQFLNSDGTWEYAQSISGASIPTIAFKVGGTGGDASITAYDGRYTGKISADSYIENLKTPSSSSAPCTPGEFTDDANYHYVCVSLNQWKRVALSAF